MKIPRDVSGTHLANVLSRRWQYAKVHQVGSHIILETFGTDSPTDRNSGNDPVRLGTLISILRAVARHKGVTRDAIIETLSSFVDREPTYRS